MKKIIILLLAVIAVIGCSMRFFAGYLEDQQVEENRPLATQVPAAQQDADVINILAAGYAHEEEPEAYYDNIRTIISNFDIALRIQGATGDAPSLGFLPQQTVTTECGGIKVAVLPLCEEEGAGPEVYDPTVTLQKLRTLKEENDLVIVTMLWNSDEELVSDHQKEVSEQLAQAGADLIMGSVPHIIQPVCRVFDSLVFYSLGDLAGSVGEDGLLAGVTVTRTVANDRSHIELTNLRVEILRCMETESGMKLIPLEDLGDTEEELNAYSDLLDVMEEEVRIGGLE